MSSPVLRDSYPEQLTLREALPLYFRQNGFAADGGYSDRWVTIQLGPLPFSFPNSAARVKAVRYHDLHHIVTGYPTSLAGEAEIAAFELASGCTRFPAAFHLNLGALALGTLVAPRRTLCAFTRGRHAHNLYADELAPLLDCTVGDLRRRLQLAEPAPTLGDRLHFEGWALAGWLVALLTLIPALPLALLAWPWLTLAKRRAQLNARESSSQSSLVPPHPR